MVDVFAGISAFNGILSAAKALRDMDNRVARNEAVIELQGQILTAQEHYSALLEQVRELKEKVTSFEKWDAEKEKYELKNLGAGSVAYMLKPEARGSTPPHWVCTNCFSDKRISIIATKWERGPIYSCPHCKVQLSVGHLNVDGSNAKWIG